MALLTVVICLDLLWSGIADSTGTVAYGLVDVPAHLAVCALALLAFSALARRWPSRRFALAALLASVAIDVDHLPGQLGWQGLEGSLPRPYTHSMLPIAALAALAVASRRPARREIWAGIGFGITAHLLRDVATGPGVSLGWPLWSDPVVLPYVFFVAALAGFAAAVAAGAARAPCSGSGAGYRHGSGAALLCALVVSVGVNPAAAVGSGHTIATGVYVYSADHPERLDRYREQVGRPPAIVGSYEPWPLNPFPRDELDRVWAGGAVPLVTWEPWTYKKRPISLRSIEAGHYDRYIHKAARFAAEWGRPLFLRFAHEMNGDWYPWGRDREGNSPRLYRQAWRRLVRIFRTEDADNVRWVWTPNVNNGSYPFGEYFPGDEWVDWVGLDGFNWGRDGDWRSFTEIFGSSYEALGRLSRRPIMVAEIGSSQSGGDKAEWLTSALRREIPAFERLRAVVWFSEEFDGVDVRVDSSPEALSAFRAGMSLPIYGGTRGDLLRIPATLSGAVEAPPAPSDGYGRPPLLDRILAKLHGRNLVYAIAAGLAGLLGLAGATVLVLRRRRRRASM